MSIIIYILIAFFFFSFSVEPIKNWARINLTIFDFSLKMNQRKRNRFFSPKQIKSKTFAVGENINYNYVLFFFFKDYSMTINESNVINIIFCRLKEKFDFGPKGDSNHENMINIYLLLIWPRKRHF